MKWKKKTIRFAILAGLVTIAAIVVSIQLVPERVEVDENLNELAVTEPIETPTLYGIDMTNLTVEKNTIKSGETFGLILDRYGIPSLAVHQIVAASDSVFDVRRFQVDKSYAVLRRNDSAATAEYFIYEKSLTDYVVFHLQDSIWAKAGVREVTVKRREVAGVIEGSLYLSLQEQDVSPVLAVRLSEIYAWTIDFFRIQAGDTYRVIFEEEYIDDTIFVGTGKIIAANLNHMGDDEYAFGFLDSTYGTYEYYDDSGESLRKAFLRAPLQFGRISSRYTQRRFHPVQKRWKAHLGTDYAAPTGTPILATADGEVIRRAYTSANGNYVKVKHNSVYTTQYLHMSRFAKGVNVGDRVRQGDVIGYVGSTGLATGPHVCYRFWKNGQQVDPLREKLPDAEPIAESIRPQFMAIMEPLKAELDAMVILNSSNGEVASL